MYKFVTKYVTKYGKKYVTKSVAIDVTKYVTKYVMKYMTKYVMNNVTICVMKCEICDELMATCTLLNPFCIPKPFQLSLCSSIFTRKTPSRENQWIYCTSKSHGFSTNFVRYIDRDVYPATLAALNSL